MMITNIEEVEKKMTQEEKDNLYFCWSLPLTKKLAENSIFPISTKYSSKTNKMCFVFLKTSEVKGILDTWHKNKPKKGETKNGQ